MILEEYKSILEKRLSNRRYAHSLNVSKEAQILAKRYGADEEKALIAGLLHDIMKDTASDEQAKFLCKYGVKLTPIELASKKLWHAISGEQYLKNELGIEDKDILNAVRFHTTGRENMSLLEKVIFIADFTSEDRDYNGVENMRKASEQSLEEAMLEGLSFTIQDLASRKLLIDENTMKAYNQIVLKQKGDF